MKFNEIQQLYDRLDAGLHSHYSAWKQLSPDMLVALSRQITAIRDAHQYLTEAHDFEPSEVDYLLSLEDPLQAVADAWMERVGDLSDFSFALDRLFQHMEIPKNKSVLDKLRGKTAEPSKPHVPTKKEEAR